MMKLSISNIAWSREYDEEMLEYLSNVGFEGVEVAPNRIVEVDPYECTDEALDYKTRLMERYGLEISSMQSIWYGRSENIFGSQEECSILLDYTDSALTFAEALGCKNVVFGCPRNRANNENKNISCVRGFFDGLDNIARKHNVVIGLEANPVIYDTNFWNRNCEIIEYINSVGTDSLCLNYDLGAVIYNEELVEDILNYKDYISHIHISEPYLKVIKYNKTHDKLIRILKEIDYKKYVSIEMKNTNSIEIVKNTVTTLKDLVEKV